MNQKDKPLKAVVVEDVLTITIGVDTLAFADRVRTGLHVTDANGYANDVARELVQEDEVGATMLTDLLDKAMDAAVENGTIHAGYFHCPQCKISLFGNEKPMDKYKESKEWWCPECNKHYWKKDLPKPDWL